MASKRKNGEGTYGKKIINGIEYFFYRDVNKKMFYGRTEKDLMQKIKKYKNSTEFIVSNKTTIYEYSLMWLENKKMSIKRKTYDGYEYIVEYVIGCPDGFDLGSKQLSSVTENQVHSFINGMATKHARSTIVKTKALLNQIFNLAVKEKYIVVNPIRDVVIPIEDNIEKKTKEIVFLSTEDMDKLTIEADRVLSSKSPDKLYYGNNAKAIVFLYNTGLRIGELIGLQWKDVDMDRNRIKVTMTDSLIKNRNRDGQAKHKLDRTSPKSKASVRWVPLSDKAIEVIKYFDKFNPNHTDKDYVFLNKDFNRIKASLVNRTLKNMLSRADCKIKHCSVHELRHSFGSVLILNGVDIKVVSKLLGHSKITTTYDIYVHILPTQEDDAIRVLNKRTEDENK